MDDQASVSLPRGQYTFIPPAPVSHREIIEPGVRRITTFFEDGKPYKEVVEENPITEYPHPVSIVVYEDETVLEIELTNNGTVFKINKPIQIKAGNVIEVYKPEQAV